METVKKSGLRGRGGAGFPTGVKWSFLPKDSDKPRYLCVNADESEPGTYKDRLIIERDPHQLIEATVVSGHAIRCQKAFIYVRGEFHEGIRTLEKALAEACAAGYVGKDILGTGVRRRDRDPRRRRRLRVRRGDGAAREPRGQAGPAADAAAVPGRGGPLRLSHDHQQRRDDRLRAADPGARGRSGSPRTAPRRTAGPSSTASAATWAARHLRGADGQDHAAAADRGPGYGGGIREGRKLKAVVPGGSSTPVLTADEIDVAMDFDSLARAGSMLGSAGTIVMDDSTCMVWMARKLT